jgi:hypothetical protein
VAAEPEANLIERALEDVLAGSSFRSSRQCQALLRYIVEHTMAHQDEMLRERVIGANVFGRAPDYDPGNDPVVRSRAAEVRKRLAQHYLHSNGHETIRIEVPSGSYRAIFETAERHEPRSAHPEPHSEAAGLENSQSDETARDSGFHAVKPPSQEQDSSAEPNISSRKPRSNWTRWALGTLAAAVLLGSGILTMVQVRAQHQPTVDPFWSPIMNTQHPVLIFIGANHSYGLTRDFLESYQAKHHLENTGREFFIDLKKGDMIDEGELIPMNQLIGFGDVAAAARMASMLTRFNLRYDLRYGSDIAVTDLQSSPTILIGGFSNVWTLEVMHQLRFRLEGGYQIVDEKDKPRVWTRKSDPQTFAGDDYAVISRLIRSETGNFVLAIAGIDTYSNQAAADFLSDPGRLGALLKTLPAGWEKKNLQIVLHTSVVKEVPAAVNVEAVEIW